jgi:alkylhydroperoxidase family enzyme
MTNPPPTVTDEMTESLLEEMGPRALVELTAFIGFANLSTRSNVALGIESQGFSADCEIPLATPGLAAAQRLG